MLKSKIKINNLSISRDIDEGKAIEVNLFNEISAICSAVNFVKNSRELLENSLKMLLALLRAKRGSIFILDQKKKILILKIAYGMKNDENEGIVKRLGEGIVGTVAKIQRPLVVDDITCDSRFINYKSRKSYKTPSFICAPLLIKDTLIGVINIADKETGKHFSESELQLLDFISTQIALNYKRLQLYQKFKKVIKKSRTLKTELGRSSKEANHLKKQIIVQEKFASLGKLAGGIAHEFNNPLDGVIRYTNLSLERLQDDDIVRGYLLEIKHGLNRMANIVRNLLACSRNFNSGIQKIDINYTIEQVILSFTPLISAKNITIERNFDTKIPKIFDSGLDLIVRNLLRNAIDAVANLGNISFKTQYSRNQIIIEIKDNGSGIAPHLIEKIFEPFYTTKEIDQGCGLGLTIVHEIVKSYNGKIKIESILDKGSTFIVEIPHKNPMPRERHQEE